MDLIVGGGTYGTRCLDFTLSHGHGCVVLDTDSQCRAVLSRGLHRRHFRDIRERPGEGIAYFVEGGAETLARLLSRFRFTWIYPTAPIHVLAEAVRYQYNLIQWKEGIEQIRSRLSDDIVIRCSEGTLIVSYNKDHMCLADCRAPDICPVSGRAKARPMHELLQTVVPEGMILRSVQMAPGIGAMKGDEVHNALQWAADKKLCILGTACRCHGVLTGLRHSAAPKM